MTNKDKELLEEEETITDEYDDFELLERLESLQEDMEDLGVSTLKEVIQKIKDLHRKLDEK
ncbi:hypothetical protein [Tengunoibacter tsumagoiensis]|uniref:Uncharacterized protein n=1 Tax=Tengunoibacter tsumagoiensis TaxID=2014871 RepID=A0A402A0S9_9CHLR|nr:hypothetical protein [Tengunoibacter tsumagoiensis]GCE12758.1 hypothetical protein KTT_26170 [Tengunoibacter tsumagoiensis]